MINILIVDDNDSNIFVLEMLVDEWFEENNIKDYKLESAANGLEAVNKLDENNYDLIFLDIMMPIMDGFEALEKIRKKNLSKQPIIILASAIIDDEENKKKAKNFKANAFIVKPLSYDTINIMMSKYLSNIDISNSTEVKNSTKYIHFDNEEKDSHEQEVLSSNDLFNEYPNNSIDIEDIQEFIFELNNTIQNIEESSNLEENLNSIIEILTRSKTTLHSFVEFHDLNIILTDIINYFESIEILTHEEKTLENIAQLLNEFYEWFTSTFIDKSNDNIYDINKHILQIFSNLKNNI